MSSVPFKMRRVSNHVTRLICQRYAELFQIHPVLEYPKCGGTWLCRMLADTLQLPFAQYASMPVAMPSIVHGHWAYHKGYRNVTFLVRDGRDVMVSFYFHFVRERNDPIERGFGITLDRLYGPDADLNDIRTHLPRFIEHLSSNPLGAPSSWQHYNNEWWDRPHTVYTRYEALRTDCIAEMTRIAEAHGVQPEAWRVERAVTGHSMERAAGRAPGEEDRGSFIRKGVVGDWVNHFSDEARQVFADLAGDTLVRLGYEQSNDWKSWGACPEAPAATGSTA